MSVREREAPPGAAVDEDLRIQLEGALDEVEAARDDFTALEDALWRWEEELPALAARVAAVVAREATLDEALRACGKHASLDPLGAEVRARRDRVRDLARAELRAVAPTATEWTLAACLEHLARLATTPVERTDGPGPVAAATTTSAAPWPLMLVAVGGVASMLWTPEIGLAGVSIALVLSSAFRRSTRWEAYADRLVVRPDGGRAWALPLAGLTAVEVDLPAKVVRLDGARRVEIPLSGAGGVAAAAAVLGTWAMRGELRPGAATPSPDELAAGSAGTAAATDAASSADAGVAGAGGVSGTSGVSRAPAPLGERALAVAATGPAGLGDGAALLCSSGVTFIARGAGARAWAAVGDGEAAPALDGLLLARCLAQLEAGPRDAMLARLASVEGCVHWPRGTIVAPPQDPAPHPSTRDLGRAPAVLVLTRRDAPREALTLDPGPAERGALETWLARLGGR